MRKPADDADPGRVVSVVGLGAGGWHGLPPNHRDIVLRAAVVVGGERHLALLPDVPGQERLAWPRPFDVSVVAERPGCVVLASGDPLLSGVGSTLVRRLGAQRVEVLPSLSSVTLARAQMGWSAEETSVVSLTTGVEHLVLRELVPGRRVLVLSADETTPAALAGLLRDAGWGASTLTVLGDLGSAAETRRSGTAGAWTGGSPRLNVVAVEAVGEVPNSWAAGLADDAYDHDGQLTKRDLRASALARLRPQPGQLLWDVGAGAGSVGIEWLRAHPRCEAVAVEQHLARIDRVVANAARLGVAHLWVRQGRAPEALSDLPDPDAVFVGGGATAPGLLDTCRERLRPGGRLVVHGVTLETERLLAQAYAAHGGELTRHAVETAEPLGTFTGWAPARAVTQWAWEKQGERS